MHGRTTGSCSHRRSLTRGSVSCPRKCSRCAGSIPIGITEFFHLLSLALERAAPGIHAVIRVTAGLPCCCCCCSCKERPNLVATATTTTTAATTTTRTTTSTTRKKESLLLRAPSPTHGQLSHHPPPSTRCLAAACRRRRYSTSLTRRLTAGLGWRRSWTASLLCAHRSLSTYSHYYDAPPTTTPL